MDATVTSRPTMLEVKRWSLLHVCSPFRWEHWLFVLITLMLAASPSKNHTAATADLKDRMSGAWDALCREDVSSPWMRGSVSEWRTSPLRVKHVEPGRYSQKNTGTSQTSSSAVLPELPPNFRASRRRGSERSNNIRAIVLWYRYSRSIV